MTQIGIFVVFIWCYMLISQALAYIYIILFFTYMQIWCFMVNCLVNSRLPISSYFTPITTNLAFSYKCYVNFIYICSIMHLHLWIPVYSNFWALRTSLLPDWRIYSEYSVPECHTSSPEGTSRDMISF